ncbi:MAG TPA: hypothetical protein VMG55_02335 [Stellaceae bacterium]|nr:hypothetical protein [Stellaceae bacterium]
MRISISNLVAVTIFTAALGAVTPSAPGAAFADVAEHAQLVKIEPPHAVLRAAEP